MVRQQIVALDSHVKTFCSTLKCFCALVLSLLQSLNIFLKLWVLDFHNFIQLYEYYIYKNEVFNAIPCSLDSMGKDFIAGMFQWGSRNHKSKKDFWIILILLSV